MRRWPFPRGDKSAWIFPSLRNRPPSRGRTVGRRRAPHGPTSVICALSWPSRTTVCNASICVCRARTGPFRGAATSTSTSEVWTGSWLFIRRPAERRRPIRDKTRMVCPRPVFRLRAPGRGRSFGSAEIRAARAMGRLHYRGSSLPVMARIRSTDSAGTPPPTSHSARAHGPGHPASLDQVESLERGLIYFKRRARLFPRPSPPSRGHGWTRIALAISFATVLSGGRQ